MYHVQVDLCNGEELCFLRGTDGILLLIIIIDELRLQRVNCEVHKLLKSAFFSQISCYFIFHKSKYYPRYFIDVTVAYKMLV
jgi:hypothetical protein